MLVATIMYLGTALGLMALPLNLVGLIGAFLILRFKRYEYRVPTALSFSLLCTLIMGLRFLYGLMLGRLVFENGMPVDAARQASVNYAAQNGLLIPLIIATAAFVLSWKFRHKKIVWLIIPIAVISCCLHFGAMFIEFSPTA